MSPRYCPGYVEQPFETLVTEAPGEDVYPSRDFRVEWGPVFHRGRLDGSARVLVIGQDPETHEAITRRVLVGPAGQRVQGLLHRIGIGSRYVMINTFLYSVYGRSGGERHAADPALAAYRHRWLDALLRPCGSVTAVVTLGGLADRAYRIWARRRPDVAAHLHHARLRHPAFPESASAGGGTTLDAATAALLADWNEHLPGLRAHVVPDVPDDPGAPAVPVPYGDRWRDGDLRPIPAADLPAGHPDWWRSPEPWAFRTGTDARAKRATITVTVPAAARTWTRVPDRA